MPVCLNLSAWIERRAKDVGPYADHIVHSVKAYEDEIERLRKMLHDQFKDWHDVDCKHERAGVLLCTCGQVEAKAALLGTEHQI